MKTFLDCILMLGTLCMCIFKEWLFLQPLFMVDASFVILAHSHCAVNFASVCVEGQERGRELQRWEMAEKCGSFLFDCIVEGPQSTCICAGNLLVISWCGEQFFWSLCYWCISLNFGRPSMLISPSMLMMIAMTPFFFFWGMSLCIRMRGEGGGAQGGGHPP